MEVLTSTSAAASWPTAAFQADPQALYAAFHELRRSRKLRHRDAAAALGVTECEAVAAAVGQGEEFGAVRLRGPWPQLFEQMPRLGFVMALTRNEAAVHEKTGRFENMSHEGRVGLALGIDIDLRIFYSQWAHGFAVSEQTAQGVQRSLQFFDRHGTAIHKVFLREGADVAAWADLIEQHRHENQSSGQRVEPQPAPAVPLRDDEVDVGAFGQAWLGLTDTHEFFPMLRKFGLTRTQALRLAPAGYAQPVGLDSARLLLQQAARTDTPIMCFVGNRGMIQIHTGPVHRVEVMGSWLNVLDPGFNLHLREDLIASAWVVRKPTSDGIVTSLELFDDAGSAIALFFGKRKPGCGERADWRALVEALPRADA